MVLMTAVCPDTTTYLGNLDEINSFILTLTAINSCITQRQHSGSMCMCVWSTEKIQVKEWKQDDRNVSLY